MVRLILAAAIGVLLLALYFRRPRLGLAATLAYLLVMGGVRRWLIPLIGYQSTDPLVLVGAMVAGMAFVREAFAQTLPPSQLSKMMAWLLGIMVAQVFNPLQGGITVGLSAAFFYVVPMLWFFIGRSVGDAALLRWMLRVFIAVASVAAAYSLRQTFVGFSEGELEWIERANFIALQVGRVRPFSFLTSPAELAAVLSSAIVALSALAVCRRWLALAPIPLLATALFFVSARGAIVTGLAAVCVVWALAGRDLESWKKRAALAAVLVVGLLSWGLTHLSENMTEDERLRPLVAHQVEGLSDPFGEKSTGSGHVAMVLEGFRIGLRNPIGYGLGSTGGGGEFGGGQLNTEGDVSNLFVSLGLPGGVLYIGIIYCVIRNTVRLWRVTRSPLVLMLLGILLQQFLSWLNGGQYSTVMFLWISIGALDAIEQRLAIHAGSLFARRRRIPLPAEATAAPV